MEKNVVFFTLFDVVFISGCSHFCFVNYQMSDSQYEIGRFLFNFADFSSS